MNKEKVRHIARMVADPENAPHQWMGDYEAVENMIVDCLSDEDEESEQEATDG